ncbi:Ferrous-iron efflux pump FieF [Gemmata obscuriglobus]|uniref:Cation-efflux pump n=1 Tax=Gemmata obscuriglobus TaxID=114 RepID=A0A2Z3H5N3_9BACT|nr:cation diffusion facilitator family transporter [Gemmata obscuriglobus]AWM38435.1 cation-efflux pump [Gemmata obscuriglobus]QEG28641.1 Ferrous-iron efflux pump FieF [Gemmata obscuriglobus]VTS06838.1 cation diffusion facilitator family transporter : Cation diffusion facilitator family transporter OS=Roseiflexus sp. (strain RS-1) GN=RoseRS_1483 PE=4 SV=1: Cation_efflux [Gemmata obscuriglobus UQM 2246]
MEPLARLRWPVALSIVAAAVTIGMKGSAYALTGSVGLLTDALESVVNLLAAVTAYFALWYASRPADPSHTYGHEKIEFFSSGLEGVLIVLAGVGAAVYGVQRLIFPEPLNALALGSTLALAASVVNFAVARVLLHYGRLHKSIVMEADGQHLMADVWTSAGVLVGLALVYLTGFTFFDSALAIVMGGHITWIGLGLIRRSFDGLMDHAIPEDERARVRELIRANLPEGATFHLLRTRLSGARRFIEFHLLVNGDLSVREGHHLATELEAALVGAIAELAITIHVEPVDEQASWEPEYLQRLGEEPAPPAQDP